MSGIIAANNDGVGMHGVAYRAQILPITIMGTSGIVAVGDALVGAAFARSVAGGARVINNSWGSVTNVRQTTAVQMALFHPLFVSAARNAVNAGSIIVFAGGNSQFTDPSPEAGLPYLFPELRSTWVAVVAVNNSGDKPNYTNRCGVAADWCIAAPGGGDLGQPAITSTIPSGYGVSAGTSMAAPQVSGAIAIIAQLFPGLTPAAVVQRLFAGANKGGQYADTTIFGQGLLDLEHATRPIGSLGIATAASVTGAMVDIDTTAINLGVAFGDGMRESLRGRTLTVFDSFDRAAFAVDLDLFATGADARFPSESRLAAFGVATPMDAMAFRHASLALGLSGPADPVAGSPVRLDFDVDGRSGANLNIAYQMDPSRAFGLAAGHSVPRAALAAPQALRVPYLAMFDSAVAVVATSSRLGAERLGVFADRTNGGSHATAALAEIGAGRSGPLSGALQLGFVSEHEMVLGTGTTGAFSVARGTPTEFAGISGELALGATYRLIGAAYAGLSHPVAMAGSLFAHMSPIQTEALTLGVIGAGVFAEGDRIGVVRSEPLRVAKGDAVLSVPTGEAFGQVQRELIGVSFVPTGREVDLEAFYQVPLTARASFNGSVLLRSEPGNVRTAPSDAAVMLRFQLTL